MDVMEAIRGRRSVRNFTSQPLTREQLQAILEAAVWAPSGGNIQAWFFLVVTDPRRIEDIKAFSPGMLAVPPALVVACSDLHRASARGGRLASEVLTLCDVSMACQNMMLAAWAQGIGSCVIRSFSQTGVAKLLGLGPGIRPELMVALGYPGRVPPAPRRRPLDEVVRWLPGPSSPGDAARRSEG